MIEFRRGQIHIGPVDLEDMIFEALRRKGLAVIPGAELVIVIGGYKILRCSDVHWHGAVRSTDT